MSNLLIVLAVLIFLIGAFILQGLRKIPAAPPHKAVLTIWGKRTDEIKDEGWRFFPICPWWYGYVLVDMTKKNQDLAPSEVRTAEDMADIEIKISLTWQPDPDFLIEYLNSGGESGVKRILENIVEEAVREFAADPDRDPKTWEDAVKMRRSFLAEIVLSIIGEDPLRSLNEIDSIAQELRRGDSQLELETLGIVLNRVNVTSIQPKGELAKAAELEAKEKRDQKAETVELDHIRARTKELRNDGYTKEQAIEILQTERGKVKKDIKEGKLSLSPEIKEMVEKIVSDLWGKLGRS